MRLIRLLAAVLAFCAFAGAAPAQSRLAAPALDTFDQTVPEDGAYLVFGAQEARVEGRVARFMVMQPGTAGSRAARYWIVDVFEIPVQVPGGEGRYAGAYVTLDCQTRESITLRARLYDADGRVVDTVDKPQPVEKHEPGDLSADFVAVACGLPDAPTRSVAGLAGAKAFAADLFRWR